MTKKDDIFSCNDIPWQELEGLFQEISGTKPDNPEREISLPDLSRVSYHTQDCDHCQKNLLELIKRYNIGGIETPNNKKEIK